MRQPLWTGVPTDTFWCHQVTFSSCASVHSLADCSTCGIGGRSQDRNTMFPLWVSLDCWPFKEPYVFLWTSEARVATKITWHLPFGHRQLYRSVWKRLVSRRPQNNGNCVGIDGPFSSRFPRMARGLHHIAAQQQEWGQSPSWRIGWRKSWPVWSAVDPMIQSIFVIVTKTRKTHWKQHLRASFHSCSNLFCSFSKNWRHCGASVDFSFPKFQRGSGCTMDEQLWSCLDECVWVNWTVINHFLGVGWKWSVYSVATLWQSGVHLISVKFVIF